MLNRFFDKDISWLDFNVRVLQEAFNKYNPLLERAKFLAISASNLDEFYMVRVANILQDNHPQNIELLNNINSKSQEILDQQSVCWRKIKQQLRDYKIEITSLSDLDENSTHWLKEYFIEFILPNIEISKNSSDVSYNNGLNYIASNQGKFNSVVNLDKKLPKFIQLPVITAQKEMRQTTCFVNLEEVIFYYKELLFPDDNITITPLYITYAHIDYDNIAGDDYQIQGDVVRIITGHEIDTEIKNTIKDLYKIGDDNFLYSDFLSFRNITQLYDNIDLNSIKYKQHKIRFPQRIRDFGGDCFAAINAKDIIVHHPYESFDVIVQFINQAASDPYVTDIKQTLYRVGKNSAIVNALIKAAKNGKNVTVIVELKARFDEKSNRAWGRELENAGARVIYDIPSLKVHAKILLINRYNIDNSGQMQSYVHYGTGNYHHLNAKIYSDLSFFTCNKDLCSDARQIFNFFESGEIPKNFNKISVAPFNLRENITSLIEDEIAFAQAGKPANIWLKMNSLADHDLINMLYKASQAGVKIELVIRGICCLRPQVKGLSENINVKSIIGRFLEHSRIYCFGAGHEMPSKDKSKHNKVFISPTDWIKRKLNNRVELMVPIENKTVHEQVLNQIMYANIKDEKQSWIVDEHGNYQRVKFKKYSFSAHKFFIENPSLSGRGSALYKKINKPNPELELYDNNEIAVIDIGSNSVRLVIYDGLKRHPLTLLNEKVTCGLAEDIEITGRLNKDGVILARKAIERFLSIAQEMSIDKIIGFATSAVRDADDGGDFIDSLQCDHDIDILSGEDEAYLAAMGIISSFNKAKGVVGDLGGGSLELAYIDATNDNINLSTSQNNSNKNNVNIADNNRNLQVSRCVSFPIGSLRLQSLSAGDKNKAAKIIDDYLQEYPLKELLHNKIFYAVGGGFRAIAKIHLDRSNHPLNILDEYSIYPKDILKTLNVIINAKSKKIVQFPISSTRKKTLIVSAILLREIIEKGRPAQISFSTHGVRDGVLFDKLTNETQNQDGLIAGCLEMINYISPNIYSQKSNNLYASNKIKLSSANKAWVEFGEEVFNWIKPFINLIEAQNYNRLIRAATILSRMAWHEHSTYRPQMAFSWVLDAKLPAIKHDERVFVATILYHRYRTRNDSFITNKPQTLLSKQQIKIAKKIGTSIRLAYQLSGGAKSILSKVELKICDGIVTLSGSKDEEILINKAVKKRLKKLNR